MIGRAEERGGRTRGRAHTQRDRCCPEHSLRAPGVFGPSGMWPARASAETGPRQTGMGRWGSAVRSTSVVDVAVLVAAGAGHTCDSLLTVVCLAGRVAAVLLENGRVGVMTTGGATSVAATCRAYLGCGVVAVVGVGLRALRATARH